MGNRSDGALVLLFLALASAVPSVQSEIDGRLGRFRVQEEVLYLWSGHHLKQLWPGLEDFMADLYWIRTVQYFGGRRSPGDDKDFKLLRPLVDIATTLDPRLEVAYRYGSVFLAEPRPIGAGMPKKGIELLERGAIAMNSWRLRKEQAYFTFLFLNDPETASKILLEAGRIPGSPYWLQTLAADMTVRGGDRAVGRRIWRDLYESHPEGTAPRAVAFRNLQYLDALDLVDSLQLQVDSVTSVRGSPPARLRELKSPTGKALRESDPTGTPFEYDPKTGRVAVSRHSALWRDPSNFRSRGGTDGTKPATSD